MKKAPMYETFVINLDHHQGRMRFMVAQLEALGVPFARFPAVNGYDPAAIADAGAASFAPLSGGEIGCWESHRRIWRAVVERDLAGAFVLEDDVILASDFGRLAFPPELVARCDVVKLDAFRQPASYGGARIEVGEGRHVQRLLGNERSTGAYFVTGRGAARLLALTRDFFLVIDEVMFRRASRTVWDLVVWKIMPAVAVQARFELPDAKLPADIEDAIQVRVHRTGTDPKPDMGAMRRMRLRLRRFADRDIKPLRDRQERRVLAAFEAGEGVVTARPEFFTPDRAHIDASLASVQ
jgi:glycosyl transferase family 25